MLYQYKKRKLHVLDGIIWYPINTNTFTCSCGSKTRFCPHLVYILETNGIDYKKYKEVLAEPHIWGLVRKRLAIMKQQQLDDIIHSFLHDTECAICLDSLRALPPKTWQCQHCKLFFHYKCMLQWKTNCPNCRAAL